MNTASFSASPLLAFEIKPFMNNASLSASRSRAFFPGRVRLPGAVPLGPHEGDGAEPRPRQPRPGELADLPLLALGPRQGHEGHRHETAVEGASDQEAVESDRRSESGTLLHNRSVPSCSLFGGTIRLFWGVILSGAFSLSLTPSNVSCLAGHPF